MEIASVEVASVEALMGASVKAFMEASVEAFMEVSVGVASVESSVEVSSVEAFVESSVQAFMEASVEVASMETFMEASMLPWKLAQARSVGYSQTGTGGNFLCKYRQITTIQFCITPVTYRDFTESSVSPQ